LASLCLLVGALNLFTFKVIIDKLPFTLLFWVQVYKPFLCFLSREDPLAFVEELEKIFHTNGDQKKAGVAILR